MANDPINDSRKAADDAETHAQNVSYWNAPGMKRNEKGEPLGGAGSVIHRPGTPDESDVDFIKGTAPEPPTPKAPKPEAWMSDKASYRTAHKARLSEK